MNMSVTVIVTITIGSVPYLEMARLLSLLQDEPGRFVLCLLLCHSVLTFRHLRLLSIEMLSNFFRSVIATSPSTLLPCVYLAINTVFLLHHPQHVRSSQQNAAGRSVVGGSRNRCWWSALAKGDISEHRSFLETPAGGTALLSIRVHIHIAQHIAYLDG